MAVLTRDELAAAVAALEWIARRADLHTVLNGMPAMRAEKKLPKVTEKGLRKAINFLKSKNGEAAETARIGKGMKITKWLQTGEFDGTAADTKELLEEACNMLDGANTADILSANLFLASNGRYYTVTVEASIDEAADDFVQDVLADLPADAEEDDDDGPERNDGEPGPAEEPQAVEVTVRGERAGQPYPPAEDPDPRPHPRFGPLTPRDEAVLAEMEGIPAEPTGKPLVDVLDTSDTPPLKVADILDRVEAEAVAGADALGRRQANRILTIAAEARGVIAADYLDMLADQIPIAWSRYGGWHLPALTQELADKRDQFQAAGGRGVELADEIDLLVMVVALREAGITTVDDLTALDGDE